MFGKDKLNTIEVLISKALIDSYTSHDELISVNNVLRDHFEMKKEIKKSTNFCRIHYIKTIETHCLSCKRYTGNENPSVKKTKQNRLMLLSNCNVSGKKKTSFI